MKKQKRGQSWALAVYLVMLIATLIFSIYYAVVAYQTFDKFSLYMTGVFLIILAPLFVVLEQIFILVFDTSYPHEKKEELWIPLSTRFVFPYPVMCLSHLFVIVVC